MLGVCIMNNGDALAARVAVLENYIVVLSAMLAIREGKPVEEATLIYHAVHDLAVTRYSCAQPGPEKDVAEKALNATHMNFERIREFLISEPR
jgi:hypothetical protein